MLALNSSFSQQQHVIELWLDPDTHQLHDPGTREVNRNDYVKWEIKAGEDIKRFKIVGNHNPFSNLPNYYVTLLGRTALRNANYGDWTFNRFACNFFYCEIFQQKKDQVII